MRTTQFQKKLVIIDNYDSFTFNLAQYLGELGCDPLVFRNDKVDLEKLKGLDPGALVISPGPGTPVEPRYFGLSLEILKELSPKVPTLGVCLGHQGIAVAFGGKIQGAPTLYHGKTAEIEHTREGVFAGIPSPFKAARYHSLIIDSDSLTSDIRITARGPEGEIMAVQHEIYPIYGVQFHPESILTSYGKRFLKNFLDLAGSEAK